MPPKTILGDTNFIKVMNELKKLHKAYPTIRIGSLIQGSMDTTKKQNNFDLNNVSSKELFKSLNEYKETLKNRKKK